MAESKHLTAVATDLAVSDVLDKTRHHLPEHITLTTLLAFGDTKELPDDETILREVSGSDFVLTGFASSPARAAPEQTAVQCAIEKNIPYGFVCDTLNFERPYTPAEHRTGAHALFLSEQAHRVRARTLYPSARLYVYGNPMNVPGIEKADVRAHFGVGGRRLIVTTGIKDRTWNHALFAKTVSAANRLAPSFREGVFVGITLHPKEFSTDFAQGTDPRYYEELEDVGRAGRSNTTSSDSLIVRIVPPEVCPGPDLISAADLVVGPGSSTMEDRAASFGIPLIGFFDQYARNRMWHDKDSLHSGDPEWVHARDGTGARVDDYVENLASMMTELLTPGSKRLLAQQAAQEKVYGEMRAVDPFKTLARKIQEVCEEL